MACLAPYLHKTGPFQSVSLHQTHSSQRMYSKAKKFLTHREEEGRRKRGDRKKEGGMKRERWGGEHDLDLELENVIAQ